MYRKPPFLVQMVSRSEALLSLCYGAQLPKLRLPKIYCDVRIKPGAIEEFAKQGFKCIRIPQSKYRELDEHDFFWHLYAENALLATGDIAFVEYAIENNIKHAGILEIPPDVAKEEAGAAAAGLAGLAKELIWEFDKHVMRRRILYYGNDGIHIIHDNDEDELFISWERIERDAGL